MKIMQCWSAAALAVALLAAGCATPPKSANGVAIVTDPNHIISRSHWEIVALPGEDIVLAAVSGAHAFDLLDIGCGVKDHSLTIDVLTKTAIEAKATRITLAYDGGAPVETRWIDTGTSDGIHSVGTDSREPGFDETILALKGHREVDVMLESNGKEVVHAHFTLEGAPAAIDYALAACGKPS